MFKSQKVGVPLGISRNSMSPVNKDELVPPSVKVPPGSTSVARGLPLSRVNWKDISGDVSRPPSDNASQKGVDLVEVRGENASPIRPET
jgi:hypothetical protein